MNKHNAIYKLYPEVVVIRGDEAFDAEGSIVEYDETFVQEYINANSYKSMRQAEYPSIADYLDAIVKNDKEQLDAYIAACLAVKAKYPKTNNSL